MPVRSAGKTKLRAAFDRVVQWPSTQLARENRPQLSRVQLSLICSVIFFSALGVRLLTWQDKHVEIVAGQSSLSGVFLRYQKVAQQMLQEGRILYPREQPVSGDARLLAHPPGYSMLLAGISRFGADEYKGLWFVQIVCDAVSAFLIFLIALELLNCWVAMIAAMLVALSPHLAYYSLLLTPDSLAVPPILLSVYLVTKGLKRPRVTGMIMAGALIGISCWLTANAMLLSLFLGAAVFYLYGRDKRAKHAAILVGSTIAVISPLTIRNFIVFDRFIPISIQAGLSLVEGIGDYDKEGKFGMPDSDREARKKDAEWNGRPDYARSLWHPDGIDRDRTRLDRGLAVVRSNPGWFLGVMVRRAAFMFSYNDKRSLEWPLNTATVAPITAEVGYGHALTITDSESVLPEPATVLLLNGGIISGALAVKDDQPVNSSPPSDLNENGVVLSPQTSASLLDGQALEVAGDSSEYGDQFASAPIEVQKNTDYVLELPVSLLRGQMALKVTSNDRRTALAVGNIAHATQEAASAETTVGGEAVAAATTTIQMPFASGNRSAVRVVLSNNGIGPMPAAVLGTLKIFEVGPTPYIWTRYARTLIRSIQRSYTTGRLRTLVLFGIAVLLLGRRSRALVLLLVVPLYYLTLHAPLHTEYRYTLAIHYFLFVNAGVTIYIAGAAISQTLRRMSGMVGRRRIAA
jgi:hypothetical protein